MFDMLFTGESLIFSVPAVFGTVIFLLKVGLMTLGADGEVDFDTDIDIDVAGDDPSGSSFNLLSIQSVAALLMGFGWGGLIGFITLDWPLWASALLGIAFGGQLVVMLGLMMQFILSFQGSGNIKPDQAIGQSGEVYTNIPGQKSGTGQVRVVIDDRARIYTAVTDGPLLTTGERVRVRAVDGSTLSVESI